MTEIKKVIKSNTLPIPVYERFGVYLMKKNGECVNYEYKDVRGRVDSDGQFWVMLAGKEHLLHDGLKFPKTEWKQIIYHDILDSDFYFMLERAYNKQINYRELTKLIKHHLVFLEEMDNDTIEIKVDGKYIMDYLESHMQYLYTEDEFWGRWYNRYILKGESRQKIKLVVYDTEFEITVDKKDLDKFYYAARLVADRLNAYTAQYESRKPEHEIALMTMLDLAILSIVKRSE